MADEDNEAAHAEEVTTEARAIIHDLLLKQGLYSSVDTKNELGTLVEAKLRNPLTTGFDAYCVSCKRETTFRISSNTVRSSGIGGRYVAQTEPPRLFAVHATCQRNWQVYTYVFLAANDKITKIGQNPSMADIAFGELRSIDKALDDVDRRELGKALGLFAHDTALGAFVYLRRVFERMIHRAHERQSTAGHPITGFATMRMDERVAALKDELPERVVQNSGVFSVLSIGIHELTEDQCAKHFPVLKAVLFQMLEQEEHKRKAAITARETEAALQRILADPTAG